MGIHGPIVAASGRLPATGAPNSLVVQTAHYPGGIVSRAEIVVRQIPVAETRPLRQTVLRPHQSLAELSEHEPADAFAVGAFAGEDLLSVGFVGPDGETVGSWRVRGMATDPRARGQGAGTAVLQALLRHAQAQSAQRVWCNARVRAISLYARAGFTVVSDRFELRDIGEHVVMERGRPDADQPALSTGDSSERTHGRKPTRSYSDSAP
jgi:ribosomal protein S18 acetylase RimI-like enzyme